MTDGPDYSGMTTNERLFVAGALDAFGEAIRKGDRKAAVRLLLGVGLEDAERIVDAVLARASLPDERSDL